jgi:hypothetical protein
VHTLCVYPQYVHVYISSLYVGKGGKSWLAKMCTASYRTYIYKKIYTYIFANIHYIYFFFFPHKRRMKSRKVNSLFHSHPRREKKKKTKTKTNYPLCLTNPFSLTLPMHAPQTHIKKKYVCVYIVHVCEKII